MRELRKDIEFTLVQDVHPYVWRKLENAPESEYVILATDHGVGEAIMEMGPDWDSDTLVQHWAWVHGPLGLGVKPLAWAPIPKWTGVVED